MAWPNPDSRFRLQGGRGGVIEFVDDGRRGRFEWEMELGEASICVWGDRSLWVESGEAIPRDVVVRLVREFAVDSGMTVALSFPDGDELVRP